MATNYYGQSYSALKKKAVKTDILFVDTLFPASEKSLSDNAGKFGKIEWKRPKDINASPKFRDLTAQSDDLSHGQYGSCAFLAASSCLTTYKPLWQKVIPSIKDQEWDALVPKKYAGIFHFLIWRNGIWMDIVVDDQLPTRDGKLVFAHSPVRKEFWVSLLEKAYAKVLGSYDNLGNADMLEVFEDFTGGVAEVFNIEKDEDFQERLFRTLKDEVDNKSLMAAIIPAPTFKMLSMAKTKDLLMGQGYGVTAVKRVTFTGTPVHSVVKQDKLNLIRLRDPWSALGWTGFFGRGSAEWKACVPLQKKLGLMLEADNEFWMKLDDFCQNFSHYVKCGQMKSMHSSVMHSEWADPNKAGGSIENKKTFLSNPQFVFTMANREDEVVLSLMRERSVTKPPDSVTKDISGSMIVVTSRTTSLWSLENEDGSAPGSAKLSCETPRGKATDKSLKSTASDKSPKDTASDNLPKDTTSDKSPKGTASDKSPKDTASDKSPKDTASDKSPKDTVSEKSPKGTASDKSPKGTASDSGKGKSDGGKEKSDGGKGKPKEPIRSSTEASGSSEKLWTIQTRKHCGMFGFSILKVEENRAYRLHRIQEVVMTSEFKDTRSLVVRRRLARGRYIVVATTLKPHETGSFMMRIYTNSSSSARELTTEKPHEGFFSRSCACITKCRYPIMIAQVVVVKATDLEMTGKTEPNPYCITLCEAEKVTTHVCKGTLTPEWNVGAIFYRRRPHSIPIRIQVWNKNTLKDTFLGEVIIEGRVPVNKNEMILPLYDRKDLTQRKPGKLYVTLTVSDNLQEL